MSHFSVLVIGEDVEGQLQRYHEFECTGIDDEFVQDVDITDEARGEFTEGMLPRLRDPSGDLHSPYDDRFYREPTDAERQEIGPFPGTGSSQGLSWTSKDWGDGRGYRAKVKFIPEGYAKVEIPNAQVETFAEFVADYYGAAPLPFGTRRGEEHKYGFARLGPTGAVEAVIKRTNPDKKWDGWVIGGRWTGKLKLKAKALGMVGRPGLMTEPAPPGYADQALKGDVDFEQMRDDAAAKARALWKTAREITGGASWESWDDTRLRFPKDIETARREYWEQPAIELLEASGRDAFKWRIDDDLALDEEVFVGRERGGACSFFAFVRDGVWTEKGSVGWFASVSDEMSQVQWDSAFNNMLDALPDDALLTVVDCHI